MAAADDDTLAQELELLAAMWSEDELKIERGEQTTENKSNASLTASLTPLTAGDEKLQFLRCDLCIQINSSYPAVPPCLTLGSSRGLSDETRLSILAELELHASGLVGEAMLLSILEMGREVLTNLNVPSGECAFCLGGLEDASDHEASEVLRAPCYHVFHKQCMVSYWKTEFLRQQTMTKKRIDVTSVEMLCPECRSEIPWDSCPELHEHLEHLKQFDQPHDNDESNALQANINPAANVIVTPKGRKQKSFQEVCIAPKLSVQPEAFIRLHHLWQGNDEKEKPLLRLLKELGLNAVIYYGKPALIHIQGEQKDVDAFAGTAKRRHITVTIDVVQKSNGPPISSGITSVPAKKGSMDGATFKEHLEIRGMGETSFTIVGG